MHDTCNTNYTIYIFNQYMYDMMIYNERNIGHPEICM